MGPLKPGPKPSHPEIRTVETRPKIYFAHPFDKWKTKQEEMIEKVLEDKGYCVVNPFREEDVLREKYEVDEYYDSPSIEYANDIVNKAYKMVRNCDEYFGWFPKGIALIGTPIELNWAFLHGKKITVLSYKPHPFLWVMSDRFYLGYANFKNDVRFYDRPIHQTIW